MILIAYVSGGFDPYGGQMMVMPYGGGPPYSINPSEYYNNDDNNNTTATDEISQLPPDYAPPSCNDEATLPLADDETNSQNQCNTTEVRF